MPTFNPPTQPTSVGPGYGMWSRYSIDVGQSVVRVGGVLILHPYPLNTEIESLVEGVDYFIGGHVYDVSDETAAELTAAGFILGEDTGEEDSDGFGEGGFGTGPFGDPNPDAPGFGEGEFGEGGYGQ